MWHNRAILQRDFSHQRDKWRSPGMQFAAVGIPDNRKWRNYGRQADWSSTTRRYDVCTRKRARTLDWRAVTASNYGEVLAFVGEIGAILEHVSLWEPSYWETDIREIWSFVGAQMF